MSKTEKILLKITTILYILGGILIILQSLMSFMVDSDAESKVLRYTSLFTVAGFFVIHFLAKEFLAKLVITNPNRNRIVLGLLGLAIILPTLTLLLTLSESSSGQFDQTDPWVVLAFVERMILFPIVGLKGLLSGMEKLEGKEES